jgi:hypothetical protein
VVHNSAAGVLSTSLIVDADVSATAAIADTKLGTIATAGKVSNSATTATSANTANAIVARDASGNFAAGTATLGGVTVSGTSTLNGRVFSRTNGLMYETTETQFAAGATLTAAQVLGGLITSTAAANITLIYPTAALLVAAVAGVAVGDTFHCIFQTTAGGNIIFTAGTGITFRRNSTVASPNAATHILRFANVTGGTEAVTVFSGAVS